MIVLPIFVVKLDYYTSNKFAHSKLLIPTYTPNLKTLRACDIIISSFQCQGVAFCYVSPVLTPWETLGYTKRTCTLPKFQVLARCTTIRYKQIMLKLQFSC